MGNVRKGLAAPIPLISRTATFEQRSRVEGAVPCTLLRSVQLECRLAVTDSLVGHALCFRLSNSTGVCEWGDVLLKLHQHPMQEVRGHTVLGADTAQVLHVFPSQPMKRTRWKGRGVGGGQCLFCVEKSSSHALD